MTKKRSKDEMTEQRTKLQSAMDFMISYSIVFLVLIIVIYVILELGIFNPQFVPQQCTAAPSFSCGSYAMFTNGTFTFILSQSVGGTLNITGIACASSVNVSGTGPAYGNVYVLPYNTPKGQPYYPSSSYANGILVAPAQSQLIGVSCYNSFGLATGKINSQFSGYVWINYTYSNLPQGFYHAEQVVSFSTVYT